MSDWLHFFVWYFIAVHILGILVYLFWRLVEDRVHPKFGVSILLGLHLFIFLVPCMSAYIQKKSYESMSPKNTVVRTTSLQPGLSTGAEKEFSTFVRYLIPEPLVTHRSDFSVFLLGLGMIYVLIAFFLFFRTLLRYRRMIEFLRETGDVVEVVNCRSYPIPIKVIQSDYVGSPFAIGFFKKMIFVPAGLYSLLSLQEKKIILEHEKIHIEKEDMRVRWFGTLLGKIFFLNPAFKKMFYSLELAQEKRCDFLLLAKNDIGVVYAKLLYKVAKWQAGFEHLPMIVSFSQTSLERRIKTMFTNVPIYRSSRLSFMVFVLFLFGTSMLLFLPRLSIAGSEFSLSKVQTLLQKSPSLDLDVRLNEHVKKYINFYVKTKKGKKVLRRCMHNSRRYLSLIHQELKKKKMPAELAYLPAAESCFRPNASSPMGAKGLWQLMKRTAQKTGLVVTKTKDQRLDPRKSTRAALRHISQLKDHFGRFDLALLAYNIGKGKVHQSIAQVGSKNVWKLINSGKLTREGKNYIPRFYALFILMKYSRELNL